MNRLFINIRGEYISKIAIEAPSKIAVIVPRIIRGKNS